MKFIIFSLSVLILIENIKSAMLRLKFQRRRSQGDEEVAPKIASVEELDALSKVALEAWISIKSPSFTVSIPSNCSPNGTPT